MSDEFDELLEYNDDLLAAIDHKLEASTKIDACLKNRRPANEFVSRLVDAHYEWRLAKAEYSQALSADTARIAAVLRRIGRRSKSDEDRRKGSDE